MQDDIIEYNCPNCKKSLKIPSRFAGQPGTCNACGNRITVPQIIGSSDTSATHPLQRNSQMTRRMLPSLVIGTVLSLFGSWWTIFIYRSLKHLRENLRTLAALCRLSWNRSESPLS